jgi:hypothetical protein
MIYSGVKPVIKSKVNKPVRNSSWVELQNEDGRKYFANARRKQSTFTLPAGVKSPMKGDKSQGGKMALMKGDALQAPRAFQPVRLQHAFGNELTIPNGCLGVG